MHRFPWLLAILLLTAVSLPGQAPGADLDGGPLPPCDSCGKDEWRIPLLPGELRLALPSPDGARLVVMGGPGTADREHTVIVLERSCSGEPPRAVVVSRSASFTPAPEELPAPFVSLAWSPDGSMLLAAGAIYRLGETDGLLTVTKLRQVEGPLLDFRFGPGDRAAAVKFLEGGRRQVRTSGEKRYAVKLEYAIVILARSIDMPIPLRDEQQGGWIVKEDSPPWIAWDDMAVLLGFPYLDQVERFVPGGARDAVELEPIPRALPGTGPFSFEDPCDTQWELRKDDRVRLRVE